MNIIIVGEGNGNEAKKQKCKHDQNKEFYQSVFEKYYILRHVLINIDKNLPEIEHYGRS